MAPAHSARQLDAVNDWSGYYQFRDRWAVVIGVSKHQHAVWDLRFAHRDAEELTRLLQRAEFGGLADDHLCLLTDEKATSRNVLHALRTFLKRPGPDDLVLLYFSSHGYVDDGEMYLITHDTEPTDIAATAVPMREVGEAIRKLKAQRVVVLADTCHSGGVVPAGRKGPAENAGVMKQYLEAASQSKPGCAWLTSAQATQVSLEGEQWGGGHGLFTHHLLEGLRGKADRQEKGLVRVGDLFDYVYEQVRKDARAVPPQHPAQWTDQAGRDLVLAVTAHLNAEERYELGRLLDELGRVLDDPGRLADADRQLTLAVNLARDTGAAAPRAAVALGLCRLSARDPARALDAFQSALSADGDPGDMAADADARFYRPVAALDAGRPSAEVVAALDDFLGRYPNDPRAGCAREVRDWVGRPTGVRRALLIAVGEFASSDIPALRGTANDVRVLGEVLAARFGFTVAALLDGEATRDDILAALDALAATSRPEDVVLVYFSGHGITGPGGEYWIPYDASFRELANAVTGREIHDRLSAIPSFKTVAVIDTHANEAYLDLVRDDTAYVLLLAASPYETAREYHPPDAGEGAHGLFTWALLSVLRQADSPGLTAEQLVARAAERMAEHAQTPLAIGAPDEPLLGDRPDFPSLFRFGRRRHQRGLAPDAVRSRKRTVARLTHPFPGLWDAIARAYLECGFPMAAVRTLRHGPPAPPPDTAALLARACAHLAAGEDGTAREVLRAAVPAPADVPAGLGDARAALLALLDRGRVRPRALLVGINEYAAADVPKPRGAVADVDALAAVLIGRWGFRPEDVTVLRDQAATRAGILDRFRALAEGARAGPALFAFSGVGSTDANGKPTVVAADSRLLADVFDDIGLDELAAAAAGADQLISVLAAGWTATDISATNPGRLASIRHAPRNPRPRPMTRALVPEKPRRRELSLSALQIGRVAIYETTLGIEDVYGLDLGRKTVEGKTSSPGGGLPEGIYSILFHAIVKALWQLDPGVAVLGDLTTASRAAAQAVVATDANPAEPLLGRGGIEPVLEALSRAERAPLAELVPRLSRLLAKEDVPEHHLNLGLARAVLGDPREAVRALEAAKGHEAASATVRAVASYHLGRLLFEVPEVADLDRAISELNDAIKLDPGLAGAHYYLGRALREAARRNLSELSVRAFREYLRLGAPLGDRDRVHRWASGAEAPR